MRVAIVEDELLALNYLKEILESQDVIGFSTITSLRSKKQAIEFFKENMVDLIFMDIHLGDGKSLGIFEEVELRTPVIFITAYDEYAIKVFRHFTIDYILKPFEPEQLYAALEKFITIRQSMKPANTLQALANLSKTGESIIRKFVVTDGHKIRSLDERQVAYFFASGKYLFITSTDDHTYLYDDTLKDIITRIDPKLFFKVNRKFVVNTASVKEVIKHSSQKIELVLQPAPETDAEVFIGKFQIAEWKQRMQGQQFCKIDFKICSPHPSVSSCLQIAACCRIHCR